MTTPLCTISRSRSTTFALLLATACAADGSPSGADAGTAASGTEGAADSTGAEPSTLEERLEILADCEPTDLALILPWTGPAFDPATGALIEPLPEGHVEAVVNGWPRYDDDAVSLRTMHGQAVFMDVFTRDGFLGFQGFESVECDLSASHSLWRDEASMIAFVAGTAHALAMSQASEMHHATAAAHWTAPSRAVPPTWQEGLDRYLSEMMP
jgi:heme-degrading monooxygenase HmoA